MATSKKPAKDSSTWVENGYGKDNHDSGNDLAVSIASIRSKSYSEPKTSGIEMRGAGAATKGRMSRGPMA
jgi:hypothetical protein